MDNGQLKSDINTSPFSILTSHLNKYCPLYAIVGSTVVMAFPYRPFRRLPAGYLNLDAYYINSNAAHNTVKTLLGELNAAGITAAKHEGNDLIKLALAGGLAHCAGKNGLAYVAGCGSRVTLAAIEVRSDAATSNSKNHSRLCSQCDKCRKACPSGALTKDGFVREKCLRHHMIEPEKTPPELLPLLKGKLWGCDDCQRCCPMNAAVRRVPVPPGLKKLLKTETFLDLTKEAFEREFAPLIGANYAKYNKLRYIALSEKANK